MKVIGIDPGVMTGYVYANITHKKQIELYPFQMTDEVDDLWRRLYEFEPKIIVMEDFDFRGGHHRAATGINYFPLQLIGVTRLYELTEPTGKCVLYMQKAAQGKSYYSDNVLKSRKLYKRGIPHGMDAMRHLLQWVTFGPGFQYNSGDQDFAKLLDKWGDASD
jgi:hypothetical protein